MNPLLRKLVLALGCEVECYRQLLVVARMKHCLLRQARWSLVSRLANLEAQIITRLRTVELTRDRLVTECQGHPEVTRYLKSARRQRASLIRQLVPVVRANRLEWNRRMLRDRQIVSNAWLDTTAHVGRIPVASKEIA